LSIVRAAGRQHQLQVLVPQRRAQLDGLKVAEHSLPADLTVAAAKLGVAEILGERGSQGGGITWRDKCRRDSVSNGIDAAGDARGNDGPFHRGSFGRHQTETLAIGW
jgi:hypothetical protein